MKTYFLSAGVPLKSRNAKYFETADVVAIRECIRAFISAVLPNARIVFGGQEAITPMIRTMVGDLGLDVRDHFILYQSMFFRDQFPADNAAFERIVFTESRPTRDESLNVLRARMLGDFKFDAGIFIGGMEGIEQEWNLFSLLHPSVPALPIASTGAAAKMIYDGLPNLPPDFEAEFSYLYLFRKHLPRS